MEQLTEYWAQAREKFPELLNFAMNIAAALVILFIGLLIARWMRRRLRSSKVGTAHIDATLRPVIATSVFYVIIAMTIYAFLTKLGVPATSLLAVFGAAGLAIGLALKDTLSNIAAGVMLLVLRPLQVGEFVDTSAYAGTVQEIGLFATTLKNLEGLYIYVPNSEVWRNRLQNFARHSEPISCRCWLPADNWLYRASNLRIAIKTALDKEGIEIPFPQRVVTTRSA